MDDTRRLLARDAVRRTIALYGQLLDEGRLEAWSQLFTDDARFRVYGEVYTGRDAIRDAIGGMQPPPDRPVKHVCLVPVIDLDGPERALAWTDFTAFGTNESGSIEIATIGRYHDELQRDGERWRFASRTLVMPGDGLPEGVAPGPAE